MTHHDQNDDDVDRLLQAGDFRRAAQALRQRLEVDPGDADAHFTLGVALDGLGRKAAGQYHFERAAALDEELGVPIALERREVEEFLADCLERLPEDIWARLEGLVIEVQERPQPEAFADDPMGFDPLLLGHFLGVPLLEQDSMYQPGFEPDTVVVFQRPHEICFPDEQTVFQELERTLYHEVGHYLGFEEADMTRLGLA